MSLVNWEGAAAAAGREGGCGVVGVRGAALVGGAAGELAWASKLLGIPSEDLPFLPFVFVLFGADMTLVKSEKGSSKGGAKQLFERFLVLIGTTAERRSPVRK